MARLRLLVGLAVALGATSLGCISPPHSRPEIRGTVLDKRSGTPVAGAVVFATWDENAPAASPHPVETLWATTDEHGQFVMPATRHGWVILGYISECPGYRVAHRDYGTRGAPRASTAEAIPPPACYSPVIDIAPDPLSIHWLQDPHEWTSLCRGMTAAACYHACETFYGTKDVCR
jgi:hypothetical protein